jgi:hypothetical protein
MTTPFKAPSLPTAAERKKKLLADGALHRAKILIARADIAVGAQPAALTREAVSHFSATAKDLLFTTLRTTAANPARLSPLLMTGLSLLSKRAIRKPLMYVGLAGSLIAGVIYLKNQFSDAAANQHDNASDI